MSYPDAEQSVKTAVVRIQTKMAGQEALRPKEHAKLHRPSLPPDCPHSLVERVSKSLFICRDCGWRVYPDPDWFDRGFLIWQ